MRVPVQGYGIRTFLLLLFFTALAPESSTQQRVASVRSAQASGPSPIAIASSGTTVVPIVAISASGSTRLESTGAPHDWGYNSAGSFVEYALHAAAGGSYQVVLRYASWSNTGVRVLVNGVQVGAISFAHETGAYTSYTDSAPLTITLPAGAASLSLVGVNGGYNLAGVSLTFVPALPYGPAFFVSPSGSDLNNGTSAATPFKTLEMAQKSMDALGMQPYTTYVMGGTYPRTQTLALSTYYDQHKSWIAYPGQVPVLDGGGAAIHGIDVSGSTITIDGLTLQNFQSGIYAFYGDHLTISNNTLIHINTPDWRTNILGGSIFFLRVNISLITGNTINGNNEVGIAVNGGGADDVNSYVTVSNNTVANTCKGVKDCGAIQFRDLGHVSVGQVITGNTITNFHTNTMDESAGIYLDDETSNVSVTNNMVGGVGRYALLMHGGDHNTITGNHFQIDGMYTLGLYQDDQGAGGVNYGMHGNKFTGNSIYSSSRTAPASLWELIDQSVSGIRTPADYNNVYYTPQSKLPFQGPIVDSSPVIKP